MNMEYKGEITGMTDENMMEKAATEAQKKELGVKAKVIVMGTEDFFGPGLLHRQSGGLHGGNSVITEEGRKFMEHYEALLEELKEMTQTAFRKHFWEYL